MLCSPKDPQNLQFMLHPAASGAAMASSTKHCAQVAETPDEKPEPAEVESCTSRTQDDSRLEGGKMCTGVTTSHPSMVSSVQFVQQAEWTAPTRIQVH